jgi:signal transduction histidine kinase
MRHSRDRRLVIAVALSFILTIVSFVVSRTITEVQSRRIQREANSISQNALVAAEALIALRTNLGRLVFEMDALRATASPMAPQLVEFEHTRREAVANWGKYVSVPFYPAEAELVGRAQQDLLDVGAAIDEIVERLHKGNSEAAIRAIDARVLPSVARVDAVLEEILLLNRQEAHSAAMRIAATTRSGGILPELMGILFAVATSYFGVRVLVRYLAWAAERSAELEQFAGRVAHDIRSPLGSVSLAVEVARRRKDIDPKMQDLLARVTATIQRVGKLIDGLLVFASAGGYIVPGEWGQPREARVGDVLTGVVQDLGLEAEMKEIQLDYEPPDPALVVACNPGVLISIMTNLISNAMKFMGDAVVRRVTIRARQVSRDVQFEVSDTGPGIGPELRERVFEPYVHGGSTAAGFGLGLATVRRLVEAHGGEVSLESSPEGGCRFWFRLPVWTESLEPRISSQIRRTGARDSGSSRAA